MLRAMPEAKKWLSRQERKRGKKKALSVLEAKIGRTVYHLMASSSRSTLSDSSAGEASLPRKRGE